MSLKLKIALAIVPAVLVVDRITKVWAESALGNGTRMELLGGLLPLTLAYNKGAAFGMSIGEDSRWFFIPVTFLALILLAFLYREAEARDWIRHTSLALIVSGALGNLYDRIFIAEGVVDFFGPVDLGFYHFPIFNVADIAITCGAILLAISFWQEEKAERAAREATEASSAASSAGDDERGASASTAGPAGAAEASPDQVR